MSKVLAYYHIVFCTKGREKTIPLNLRTDLYRFIWNEINEMKCTLIRIGGISNHLHLLIALHLSVSLSDLVKNIKGRSSGWLNRDPRFPDFRGWARDYFASTISPDVKPRVIEYINGQEEHHKVTNIDDEFRKLYSYAGLQYDSRDMTY